jgi:hypothetical protein
MVEHPFRGGIGRRIMMINARQIPERIPALILMSIDDITTQEDQRQETERQKHLAEIIIDAAPASPPPTNEPHRIGLTANAPWTGLAI